MPIVAECDDCRKRYSVDDRMAGKRVKCKNCGNVFTIPGRSATGTVSGGTVAGRSASAVGLPSTDGGPAVAVAESPAARGPASHARKAAAPPPPPQPSADDPPDFDELFKLADGDPVDAAGPIPLAPPPVPQAA